MGFHQLIDKVAEAEQALEAHERSLAANLRQTRSSWHAAWTPGRIVIAGFAGGFLVGHGNLVSKLGGSNLLQLVAGFANLVTGGMQAAAEQFSQMQAGMAAEAAPPPTPESSNGNGESEALRQHYERMRRDGLV